VPLVDFVKIQSQQSRNGIPGAEVFLDHVHPTIESHRLLAIKILETMDRENWINLKNDEVIIARVTKSVMNGINKDEHAVAMMNLAKVLGWAGKRQEAYLASKKSIELNPESANGQFQAGLAAFLASKIEEAIIHYRHALKLDPSHSDAHCNLGGLLEDKGDLKLAIHHFKQALQIWR
jgi:tetratricopeptide (TPR) repeat protein